MVASACVCSHVAITQASNSFSMSKSSRKSETFFASGNRLAAAWSDLAFTSHSATMFSDCTASLSAAPRPPAPMTAMFSLLLRFCPRKTPAPTSPPPRRQEPSY